MMSVHLGRQRERDMVEAGFKGGVPFLEYEL